MTFQSTPPIPRRYITYIALVWPRVGLLTEKNAIKAHSPRYFRNHSLPHSVYAGAARMAPPSQILMAYRLSG